MIRLLFLNCLLLVTTCAMAGNIIVKNIDELNDANKKAQPGDIIILKNGTWNDVVIKLSCTGTAAKPITFRAETAGKVMISGHSQLRLGGSYIVVDGLYFTNGYAGDNTAVIDFRISKTQLANHCRVTNCSINDFNNPKRMDDNNWISFSGRNNRLDHCNFKDKKNMGVLLAVILDDDLSRENFHSIDHNYFGRRPALGSNGGEMIRVGVSQHCQFNSNTQIIDNLFDQCDGETEIISIKSGSNVVRGNVFKECQGGVVLRHGDNNTVENNLFLGNNKTGTGGVRIINKGQWVVNNLFYKCRGVDFRSPLSLMNGVPNSPAFRYVQVTDAVVANNTFIDCSSISFCEGSDKERSLAPDNVVFINNLFYNQQDSIIYRAYDDIKGFKFERNIVSSRVPQELAAGFQKENITVKKVNDRPLPIAPVVSSMKMLPRPSDSLQLAAQKRLNKKLSPIPGFHDPLMVRQLEANAYTATGNSWFKKINAATVPVKFVAANCATAEEIYTQLEKKEPVLINLTAKSYTLTKPFLISKPVIFSGVDKSIISIITEPMLGAWIIGGNGHLTIQNADLNLDLVKATHAITSDSSGSSSHFNLVVKNNTIRNVNRKTGCVDFFNASKSMIADSIVAVNNLFVNIHGGVFMMTDEKDDKGYYNAEKIIIKDNAFESINGIIMNIYRGGNDESTLGPNLTFSQNKLENVVDRNAFQPLFTLTGVQYTTFFSNSFINCSPSGTLLQYKDTVRARHTIEKNLFKNAGKIEKDDFVTEKDNTIN